MVFSNRLRGPMVIVGVAVVGGLLAWKFTEDSRPKPPEGEVKRVESLSYEALVGALPADIRSKVAEPEVEGPPISEVLVKFRPTFMVPASQAPVSEERADQVTGPSGGIADVPVGSPQTSNNDPPRDRDLPPTTMGPLSALTQVPAHLSGREVQRTREYIAVRRPEMAYNMELEEFQEIVSQCWKPEEGAFRSEHFGFAARMAMANFMEAELDGDLDTADAWASALGQLQTRFVEQHECVAYPTGRSGEEPVGWLVEAALFTDRPEARARMISALKGMQRSKDELKDQFVRRFVGLRIKELAELDFPSGFAQIYAGTRVVMHRDPDELAKQFEVWFAGNPEPFDPLETAMSAAYICERVVWELDSGRESAVRTADYHVRTETFEVPSEMIHPMGLDDVQIERFGQVLSRGKNMFGKLFLANRLNMTALVNQYFDQVEADRELRGWIEMLEGLESI